LSNVSGGADGGQYSRNREELSSDELSQVSGGADGGQYGKHHANDDIVNLDSN
jgi:bacteriocin-like protein